MSVDFAHTPDAPERSSTRCGETHVTPRRIAYVMSRFPKLTETFILDEILEHERMGVRVEVFPLWREHTDVIHDDARPIVARAHFTPTLDAEILRDNLRCFMKTPALYLRTIGTLVIANLRSPRYLLGALGIFPKACSFAVRMQRLGIRHVHAHFASHPAAAAFVVGRLAKIPWSFTAHGSDLHREQSMLREKVAEAAFVVTISDYNRHFMLEHVGEQYARKINVIHCGVDASHYDRVDGRRLQSGTLEIACIGTLHEVKGQRYLLEACAELTTQDLVWRCHLIGDGPDRAALESHARSLGISNRVIFHGSCERERVRALLAEMNVCVAPSVLSRDGRREGIPIVLMEAAAFGLPLIASRLSGIPELVQDDETGLLVQPKDVAGLAQALTRIAAEPATRSRLGSAARERLETDFDLARNVSTLRNQIFPEISA
jgi:colanic acid/amylovoran biosynthesis glycosyltransferase